MNSYRKMVREAWRFDKRLFVYFALNIVLTALFAAATLYAPKLLITEILTTKRESAILLICVAYLAIAGGCGFFVSYWKHDYLVTLKELRASLLRAGQKKDLTRSYADLENPAKRDESWYAQRAAMNFSTGFEGIYARLFSMSASLVTLLLYVWVLFSLSVWVGIFLLACSVGLYFYSRRHQEKILQYEKELTPTDRREWYVSRLSNEYRYGKDIRVYGMADWMLAKLQGLWDTLLTGQRNIAKSRFCMALSDILFTFARGAAVYAYLIYLILEGRMGIADFTLYFSAVTLFSAVLKQSFDDLSFIGVQRKQVDAYYEFMERPDEREAGRGAPVTKLSGYDIAFCNVSFTYPGTDKKIFDNLSFSIQSSERLAIVGVNGAGKTTLVKLLTRLYAPDSGQILVGGVDIQTLDLTAYRELFSVVFQDFTIMAATLGENITLSEDYDAGRAVAALEQAGFLEFYQGLEKGLDTQILKSLHAEGIELSGGEKQKLALARAFYQGGDILVLDEPTAALDAIAEHALYEQFAGLTGGRTALFISHRLASTRFCDHILLLDGTRGIEFGTHEALMQQNGLYRKMFETQMQYYKEDVRHAGV